MLKIIFQLLDLSDQMVRFRLYGPKSFEVLREVLTVVEENELEKLEMKEFMLAFIIHSRKHGVFCGICSIHPQRNLMSFDTS